MTTAAPPAVDQRARQVRIGLWGATSSGKTTMLSALQIAISMQRTEGTTWIVSGIDDPSSDFLSRHTAELSGGAFPSATQPGSVNELGWRFVSSRPPRWPRRRRIQTAFEVRMLDMGGGDFLDRRSAGPDEGLFAGEDDPFFDDDDEEGLAAFDPREAPAPPLEAGERLIRHMSECDGLVYLFDPVREWKERDAFRYFHRPLEQLTRRAWEQGRLVDGRLPQFLAVCVTKFDDRDVFAEARRAGIVMSGAAGDDLPYVPADLAGEFFTALAETAHRDSAKLVRGSIETHFAPDRVGYFVSSSVGLYVGDGGRFRPHDPSNVLVHPDGTTRLRGDMRPVNVLEPFVWLDGTIRARASRGR